MPYRKTDPVPPGTDNDNIPTPSAVQGAAFIRAQLRNLPASPGVYRMIDEDGDVLYVGKAKNLQRRVAAYTQIDRLTVRLQRMVARTVALEIVTTHTEAEALLLESNLIKQLLPHFNILLRDDKSFPYILITGDHEAPQVLKHRGARKQRGQYFGPFASAASVNHTISILQRAFLLRSCSDTIYASRTRPCLQYQIKRCSAPCVGRVSPQDYQKLVEQARDFLSGRSRQVQEEMAEQMQAASDALDFETAAKFRDRIRALTQVQAHQGIHSQQIGNADVIALYQNAGATAIQVFFFRNGSNYGNRSYFPSHDKSAPTAEILASFIGQFYANKDVAPLLLTSEEPAERHLLEQALALKAGRKITIVTPQRGDKRQVVEHAYNNAREVLARRLAESGAQQRLLEGVAEIFELQEPPKRIEIYDNSHIGGKQPYGVMVVAGLEGFIKSAYRKFSISEAAATKGEGGDDYAMMREVMSRRFGRALKEDPERKSGTWPDLVLIDGGAGQLAATQEVLDQLGITDITIAAIAKGPDRNAGREKFFVPGKEVFSLERKDPVLYYLQRLRDEAHRFAIGTHRAKRSKLIGQSPLDDIAGIGAHRKRALLRHFGSAAAVAVAGIADLRAVPGIDAGVAQKIYDHFHTA